MVSHSSLAPWDHDDQDLFGDDSWNIGDDDDQSLDGSAESRMPDHGEQFVSHLLMLYISRKLSAQDCCIAMYHASKRGITEATPFAKRPGLSSGKYNDHLSQALGYRSDSTMLYELVDTPCNIPGWQCGMS